MITKKQFLRALRKRTEADLIISRYNLQESTKMVELYAEARSIMHTFQNGHRTDAECFNEAREYLRNRKDEK